MLALATDDYRLEVDPQRGGSILRFDWKDEPVLRPVCGGSIFDVACFPLVPFSNRIANGRFQIEGRDVRISPNFPGSDHPHPLHGFGWLRQWSVLDAGADRVVLEHRLTANQWPWSYCARQTMVLNESGLSLELQLRNDSDSSMPAGLGFHPYFPRDSDTIFSSAHRGEWRNSADCLPVALERLARAKDWWQGMPVGSRAVDTLYTDREGPLCIAWPSRGRRLRMTPSSELDCTVVFTPKGQDYFCVEPVSHATNAVNAQGMPLLRPGSTMTVGLQLEAEFLL